jgi:hypothetical protein
VFVTDGNVVKENSFQLETKAASRVRVALFHEESDPNGIRTHFRDFMIPRKYCATVRCNGR